MHRDAPLGQPQSLPGVHKIAILRANALGDFIFTLPALNALRNAYPDAEIVLLATEWHRRFLETRPCPINRVVPVPPALLDGTVPLTSDDAVALFERIRQERFDLAIQLHGGGRYSNPFLLELHAGVTIGFKTSDAPPLDRWTPYVYFQNEVLRNLEAVALAGAAPVTVTPQLPVTSNDLAEAHAAVGETNVPVVALHPGAGSPRRRWAPERFAAVGDTLAATGARIVLTGTEAEHGLTQAVARAMSQPADDVCGRLSLGGLAGLFSQSLLVISNDSGPLHLARAVGAPTVGIYWCGNMINAGPLSTSKHRTAISWCVTCPECGQENTRTSCDHTPSFVDQVTVDEVVAMALDLLQQERQRHEAKRDERPRFSHRGPVG